MYQISDELFNICTGDDVHLTFLFSSSTCSVTLNFFKDSLHTLQRQKRLFKWLNKQTKESFLQKGQVQELD